MKGRKKLDFGALPRFVTYQGLTEGLVLFICSVKNGRGRVDEQVIVHEFGLGKQFALRFPITGCQIHTVHNT